MLNQKESMINGTKRFVEFYFKLFQLKFWIIDFIHYIIYLICILKCIKLYLNSIEYMYMFVNAKLIYITFKEWPPQPYAFGYEIKDILGMIINF